MLSLFELRGEHVYLDQTCSVRNAEPIVAKLFGGREKVRCASCLMNRCIHNFYMPLVAPLVMTPQAIRSPELPAGSVTLSSAVACTTMALPSASKTDVCPASSVMLSMSASYRPAPSLLTYMSGRSPAWGPAG